MNKMRVGILGVIIIAVFTTGLDLQGMHFFGVGIASLNLWSVLGCVLTAFSWAITAVVTVEGIYKRWLWKFNFLLGISMFILIPINSVHVGQGTMRFMTAG